MGVNFVTKVRNFRIEDRNFSSDSHDVHDGCVTPGQHRGLRFDFLTYNAGDADAYIGRPEDRPDLFVWSEAHGHFHLKDFNEFVLYKADGTLTGIGRKQAFCLMDLERTPVRPRPGHRPRPDRTRMDSRQCLATR